jgi:hypothetical protein
MIIVTASEEFWESITIRIRNQSHLMDKSDLSGSFSLAALGLEVEDAYSTQNLYNPNN